MTPKPKDRFRPRADAGYLSRAIHTAWEERQAAAASEDEQRLAGEIIAAHLESLYPADDMAVLARYGCVDTINGVNVRIYDPSTRDWREGTGVHLPRLIVSPSRFGGLYSGGPVYSGDTAAGRGVTERYWTEMSPKERAALIEDQDAKERSRVPRTLDAYFQRIVRLRQEYRSEYSESMAWPTAYRAQTGAHPTWADIAATWPVLGAYLRRGWSATA